MKPNNNVAVKTLVTMFFTALPFVCLNAQNQKGKIDQNNAELQRLEQRARERNKGILQQASPYDAKYRDVPLNPMMPDVRGVDKYKVIDNGSIRILYAFNATDISNPATYDDLQRLEIGQKYVKYYSAYVYQKDSCETSDMMEMNRILRTNYRLDGDNICIAFSMPGKHQGWSQYIFSEFFKDLSANEMTEYSRMPESLEICPTAMHH